MLSVLERPASFPAEQLQTMIDLVRSVFPGEGVIRQEKNQNFLNPIVNNRVRSVDLKDVEAVAAAFSSMKELLLEYKKSNSGRVWRTKRSTELDILLRRIDALLNPDRGKMENVCIPSLRGPFLM